MDFFLAAFLVLPILALTAKEFGKLKLNLWVIFALYVVVGWLLIHLSVERYFDLLDEAVRSTPNPSSELLNKWQSDGAARVFASYLGWAQAAIYFLFWLWMIKIASFYIRKLRSSRTE